MAVAARDRVHGSVAGRVDRLLLDAGHLDQAEAASRMSRRLSVGAPADDAAAWLDGFLSGESVLLVHDPALLTIVDEWVAGIGEETFEDLLPLLRRTFSRYQPPERATIARQVARLGRAQAAPATGSSRIDLDRARPAVARVAALLGWEVRREPRPARDARPARALAAGPGRGGPGAAGRRAGRRRSEPLGRRPAPRRGVAGAVRRRPARRAGRLGAEGVAVAGRHPGLLPDQRRPGDAGRRHGPARPAAAAARAGDDAVGHPRRAPGQHARRPRARHPGALARDRPHRRPHRDRPARGAAARQDRAGRRRGPRQVGSHPQAQAPRRRLAAHHRREPPALPARAPDRRARAPGRLRPAHPPGRARHHPLHRPVGLDGRVGRLLQRLRRRARLGAVGAHQARRLRHRDRRPHRRDRRPRRRALRRPARRRHRHQPGARLLRGPGRAPDRHGPGADQRPLRGRHRRGDAAPGAVARRHRRHRRRPARAQRQRPPVVRRRPRRRSRRHRRARPSPAPRTCSPT